MLTFKSCIFRLQDFEIKLIEWVTKLECEYEVLLQDALFSFFRPTYFITLIFVPSLQNSSRTHILLQGQVTNYLTWISTWT